MQLTGEESNYHVLNEVVKELENGTCRWEIVDSLKEFLAPKKVIMLEIDELRIKARSGCDESARELMKKLVELKDGP